HSPSDSSSATTRRDVPPGWTQLTRSGTNDEVALIVVRRHDARALSAALRPALGPVRHSLARAAPVSKVRRFTSSHQRHEGVRKGDAALALERHHSLTHCAWVSRTHPDLLRCRRAFSTVPVVVTFASSS